MHARNVELARPSQFGVFLRLFLIALRSPRSALHSSNTPYPPRLTFNSEMGRPHEGGGALAGLNWARRAAIRALVRGVLPRQLRQPSAIDRNPPHLVVQQHPQKTSGPIDRARSASSTRFPRGPFCSLVENDGAGLVVCSLRIIRPTRCSSRLCEAAHTHCRPSGA
jgi:hypothetical protein